MKTTEAKEQKKKKEEEEKEEDEEEEEEEEGEGRRCMKVSMKCVGTRNRCGPWLRAS